LLNLACATHNGYFYPCPRFPASHS
jgi:hypothetical protein